MEEEGQEPQPGQRYIHFEGKFYEVICTARESDMPNEQSVICKSLYDGEFPRGTIWRHSLVDFMGYKSLEDGTKVKRFTLIK